MPSFESDADLILASHDSPLVFAEIFDRHFDPIHAYLARRVGRQLADELASDVFLQAFMARHRYDADQPNARPWLYGIASPAEHRCPGQRFSISPSARPS